METLKAILPWSQAIISILLILFVLFQNSGVGLSSTFGGSDMPEMTKRGPEKFLYVGTVVVGLILVAHSLFFLYIR